MKKKNISNLFSILVLATLLISVVACGDAARVAEELTPEGYPVVNGTYSVVSTTCSFAELGAGFSISQDEASLSISASVGSGVMGAPDTEGYASSSAVAGEEIVEEFEVAEQFDETKSAEKSSDIEMEIYVDGYADYYPADSMYGEAAGGNSSLAGENVSFSTAEISKEGEVTLTVSSGTVSYDCEGLYYGGAVSLSCGKEDDITSQDCTLIVNKISDETPAIPYSAETEEPVSPPSGNNPPSTPLSEEFQSVNEINHAKLQENVVGSWCNNSKLSDIKAITINSALDINLIIKDKNDLIAKEAVMFEYDAQSIELKYPPYLDDVKIEFNDQYDEFLLTIKKVDGSIVKYLFIFNGEESNSCLVD